MRQDQIRTEPHKQERTDEDRMGRDWAQHNKTRLDGMGWYRTGRDGAGCGLDRPEQTRTQQK